MGVKKSVAIDIKNVSKSFILPHEKTDSLKTGFTSMFTRKRSYSVQHALSGVDFQIYEGEFFGIVGRNGSGKSTLLKMIAGIYQPSKGKIKIRGKLVPFIELGVGFNPRLSGRENVYLNGAMLGKTRKQIREDYDNIVRFAELEEFMDQKLKNYSSGMQVRLAFACAAFADADILLVDEVLAVGDSSFQKKCFEHFRKLKQQKKTVIFVSHNMDSVREFCTRAALIDKSKLVDIGDPNKISHEYSKLFIKNNQTHLLRHTAEKWGEGDITFESIKMEKNIYTSEDPQISFGYTLFAAKEVEEKVRVGIIISNSAGQSITGINTEILEFDIPRLSAGERIRLKWDVDNIFKQGNYSVTLAVESTSGTVYEWWSKAVEFTVDGEYTVPYIVLPKITASVV